MGFRGPVVAVITEDRAKLVMPLVYEGRAEKWVIPEGFWTDFATVPRMLTWAAPRMGSWTRAAIVHDWFCVGLKKGECPVSAVDADGVFRRIMREEGTGFGQRWLMWAAVRWAAASSWYRRPGWWSTAPLLLGITVGVLAVVVGGVAGVYWAGRLVAGWLT